MRSERHPPGSKALQTAAPRGVISSSCLPHSWEQPRMVPEISPALQKVPPALGHVRHWLSSVLPCLSHFQPQETQVSETLSSLTLQMLSLAQPAAARQPHRAVSRGSLSLSLPVQVPAAQAVLQTVAASPTPRSRAGLGFGLIRTQGRRGSCARQ